MNGIGSTIVFLAAAALLALPRRWALLPLMLVTCSVPFYAGFDFGGGNFTAVRMMIAVGILRVAIRGEMPAVGANGIDYAVLAWAFWLLTSGFFHDDPSATLKFRSGLVYDALGIYIFTRGICRSVDDVLNVCVSIAIAIVPLAAVMLYEKSSAQSLLYLLGGHEVVMIRDGHLRASGPFGHPILAGTVGGVSLPLMAVLWKMRRRLLAGLGIAACLAIIFSSASSGPILTALAGLFALWMWRYRRHIRIIQLTAVAAYIALDIVMKDPAYFLIARIDLVGGSTSYYRARLIQSAFEHLSEWWLTGTDITRHWMWTIIDPHNTDITNHFIQMGVYGGLTLMLLYIIVLINGFAGVTRVLRQGAYLKSGSGFLLWTFGSSLFAFAVTGLSISFFDQSLVFFYVVLGTIGSASLALRVEPNRQLGTSHPARSARVNGRAFLHPSSQLSTTVE